MTRTMSFFLMVLALQAGGARADVLDTHTVVLDEQGLLLSWVTPQDRAYAEATRLSANFIVGAMSGPIDGANGLPAIFTHSEYDPDTFEGSDWPNNPAGKNAMLADGMLAYYAFSGDSAAISAVRSLLDHQLTYGTTPSGFVWGNVPWSAAAASSIEHGNDDIAEGIGNLEPDKVGELGYHGYLRFWELTGETAYLDAAIGCADALAANIRPGDATHSPWPFRVVAETGATPHPADEYCDDTIGPIRLFDELIRLGLGDTAAYQSARDSAWGWLLAYPMQNDSWAEYFEDIDADIGTENQNQYNPGQTARYLLEHPELDPNWQTDAAGRIDWIETTFGGTDQGEPGLQYGARVISEQDHYRYKMASHTSRFGAINALYAERTGDLIAKEKAFRSLNWCTYMVRANGAVIEGPAEHAHNPYCWYSDGHGDYIRHFLLAMGAFPEWAPADENHLLRSTSIVRSIGYAPDRIAYATFDAEATEVLRVFLTPTTVLGDGTSLPQRSNLDAEGWTFDPASGVLRVRHDAANQIEIQLDDGGSLPTVYLTAPNEGAIFTAPAAIAIEAQATGHPGPITKVEFFSGTTKLGEDLTEGYQFLWNDVPIGDYELTARATDDQGRVGTSIPVHISVVNPILGSSGEGTSTDYLWSDGAWINAGRFPALADMVVTTMFAKVTAISGSYKCAIYADESGAPGTLLRETAEVTGPPADGWYEFPLTAPLSVSQGGQYWLAIWSDDIDAHIYTDDDGTLRWGRYDYGAWPDPLGTSGGGSYGYSIYATVEAASALPGLHSLGESTEILLHGSVPNPFRTATSIGFELASTRHVLVTIFDSSGRRVRRLLDEELSAGRHEVLWDGSSEEGRRAASGVYFYRIRVADVEVSRPLLMVR